MKTVLEQTAAMIPECSEYYSIINNVMGVCRRSKNWRHAWEICLEELKEYSWVHAYPNAAAEVVAIWFGENDFAKMLEIICLEGHDADCTAAQLLTAAAIITGMEKIDAKWINSVSGELDTYLYGMEKIKIEDLVKETTEAWLHFECETDAPVTLVTSMH